MSDSAKTFTVHMLRLPLLNMLLLFILLPPTLIVFLAGWFAAMNRQPLRAVVLVLAMLLTLLWMDAAGTWEVFK